MNKPGIKTTEFAVVIVTVAYYVASAFGWIPEGDAAANKDAIQSAVEQIVPGIVAISYVFGRSSVKNTATKANAEAEKTAALIKAESSRLGLDLTAVDSNNAVADAVAENTNAVKALTSAVTAKDNADS